MPPTCSPSAKVAHLNLLPQGQAEKLSRVEAMVETMDEYFGSCTNYGECEAACPKSISIDVIALMNADYLKAKLKNRKKLAGRDDGSLAPKTPLALVSRCGWRRPAFGRTLDLTIHARCAQGPSGHVPRVTCATAKRGGDARSPARRVAVTVAVVRVAAVEGETEQQVAGRLGHDSSRRPTRAHVVGVDVAAEPPLPVAAAPRCT